MDKQYVWRPWVRWSIRITVTIIFFILIWVGMLIPLRVSQKSSGYEYLMSQPAVEWDEDVRTWVQGEDSGGMERRRRGPSFTLGDPMTMDTSECEDGDYLSFVRDLSGRLVLICTSGEARDVPNVVD